MNFFIMNQLNAQTKTEVNTKNECQTNAEWNCFHSLLFVYRVSFFITLNNKNKSTSNHLYKLFVLLLHFLSLALTSFLSVLKMTFQQWARFFISWCWAGHFCNWKNKCFIKSHNECFRLQHLFFCEKYTLTLDPSSMLMEQ